MPNRFPVLKMTIRTLLSISIVWISSSLVVAQDNSGWLQAPSLSSSQLSDWISAGTGSGSSSALPSLSPEVSDFEASASLGMTGAATTATASSGGNDADEITDAIRELACGLNYDPLKIFEYVYNYIEFEGYYGCKKGAHLTLLEGSGNDFDQCALMVALLRASGKNPSYGYGPHYFSYDANLVPWFGLSPTPFSHLTTQQFEAKYPLSDSVANRKYAAAIEFFSAGGYFLVTPSFNGNDVSMAIPHVWVEVDDEGTLRRVSPSFKGYQDIASGIDIATASGYSRSEILGDAAGTVSSSPDSVTDLDYAALSSRLNTYTQNFLSELKTNHFQTAVEQITGTRDNPKFIFSNFDVVDFIAPTTGVNWLSTQNWTAIPEVHMSKLRIRCGDYDYGSNNFTSTTFDETINLPALRGRKLSLTFSGNTASIRLDEALVGPSFTVSGSDVDVQLHVSHDHYLKVPQGGGWVDVSIGRNNQTETKPYYKGDDHAYAFVYSFANPDKLSRERQEVLDEYRRSGLTDADWEVRSELLNIMGLQWLYQSWQQQRVLAPLFDSLPLRHHRFGRAGYDGSFYIDVGLQRSAMRHRGGDEEREAEFLHFGGFVASAMEHGVIEQLQGDGTSAASTVQMIFLANDRGIPIYRGTSSNWTAVSAQLNTDYTPAAIAQMQNAVTNLSGTVLVPEDGEIALGQWEGSAYAIEQQNGIQMKISDGLHGGFNSQTGFVDVVEIEDWRNFDPSYLASASSMLNIPYNPVTTPVLASTDPVDMLSGAFFLDKTELTIGSGVAPRGISFSRHYNSNRRYDKSVGLGYGWTHSYDISAMERSSVKAGLAETISYQAAPFFVAMQAAADLYSGHSDAKEWVTAALIVHWAIDQLKHNAVAIRIGNRTLEFVEMPDGTFEAPGGVNMTLSRQGSGSGEHFVLTERNGSTYTFNPSGKIASIVDLWGKTQSFNYSGPDLSTVQDGYGRTITFGWNGDKISTLSDTNGRSVGFSYTDNDLTGVTDVEGKTWGYQYDSEHRITHVTDPSLRLIVQNEYDTEGRVKEQYTFGDTNKKYTLCYTGYCNIEEDPEGGRTCYLYDHRGRALGIVDPLGNLAQIGHDGHDRRTIELDAEESNIFLEGTVYVYDKDNNLTQVRDSELENSFFGYDGQDRVDTLTDRRGYVTTIDSFNSTHQPLQVTAPLNRVTTTTYLPTGEKDLVTDPEDNVTDYDYNGLGQLTEVKLNGELVSKFTYNSYGDVHTVEDGLGQVTTHTYNKRRQLRTTTYAAIPDEPEAIVENIYNDNGRLESTIDPRGNAIEYTYSPTGKLKTTTLPEIDVNGTNLDNVITRIYEDRDLLYENTNSLGHTTTHVFDAAHRLTDLEDPLDRVTKFEHDGNGRVVETTDPLLRITKVKFSKREEPEIMTDAMNRNIVRDYDENGNLTEITNRRLQSYVFDYDAANRLTDTTTPLNKVTTNIYWDNDLIRSVEEPSGDTTTFEYDDRLRLDTTIDPEGTIVRVYDDADNLFTVTEGSDVITRTYDERNRLRTFTNADGDLIKYDYDAANNLTKITYPPDTEHPGGKEVVYGYDARNQLKTVTDWAGRVTTYWYDRLGRLDEIDRPNNTMCKIEYDDASQIASKRETANGRLFFYQKFSYDDAGQIEELYTVPQESEANLSALSATYDVDNRLDTVSGQNITHDDDGNMTVGPLSDAPGFSTLVYNARNQLTSADGITYTYDAEGRRRTMTNTGGATRYTIDPNGPLSRLLIEHHPNGTKTYYVYGRGLLYEATKVSGEPEQTLTYHYDQVGSTRVRTDDAGRDVGRAEYGPYGGAAWTNGDMNTPFLYNGKFGVISDENDLLHMRARYFSPYLKRFVNADPIGFGGGMNWYAYVDGNPIGAIDPTGLVGSGVVVSNDGWVDVWTGRSGSFTGTNKIDGPVSAIANFVLRFGDAQVGDGLKDNLNRLLPQLPDTESPVNVNLGSFDDVTMGDVWDIGFGMGNLRYTKIGDTVTVSDVWNFPLSQSDWEGGTTHHNAILAILVDWAGKDFNVSGTWTLPPSTHSGSRSNSQSLK